MGALPSETFICNFQRAHNQYLLREPETEKASQLESQQIKQP
jgi:hypothetical protein